jgi:hypothetical protein
MKRIAVALIGALLISQTASADVSTADAKAICAEVSHGIGVLIPDSHTTCLPSAPPGKGLSLSLIAGAPVLSSEATWKGWLLVAVAAAGKAWNDRPIVPADELVLSDRRRLQQGMYYVLPAETVRLLQRRIAEGELTLDAAYIQILQSLQKRSVAK